MRLFFLCLILFAFNLVNGQTENRFVQEVNALDSLLQKTTSFREQLIPNRLTEYQQLKTAIRQRTDTATVHQRFFHLSELISLVRDNHLGFYQRVNYSLYKSNTQIDSLYASDYFNTWPVSPLPTDSLKQALSDLPRQELTGIYTYGEYYKMALVKTGPRQYQGIVVESAVPYMKPGQLIAWLTEKGDNRFSAIYLHPLTHNFLYHPIERFEEGTLLYSSFYQSYYNGVYSKAGNTVDYCNLPDTAKPFLLTEPRPSVRYVRVSSFANNGIYRRQSDSLVQLLGTTLPLPYTIVDLRNNTGGAGSMAKPYIRWIKQQRKKSKVLVLINANTISMGEITAVRLSKLKGVLLAGQQTKGMLAYGSNYGKHIPLPSGEFSFYPTDMRTPGLLYLEDNGIAPALPLSGHTDWLLQLYRYLKIDTLN